MDKLEQQKYPIGKFELPTHITDIEIDQHIKTLKDFPGKLKKSCGKLDG